MSEGSPEPQSSLGLMQSPVLVLNASYEPINVTPVRRAVILIIKGVATAEEANGSFIHSSRASFRVPSVIRLREFCSRALPAGELTLDHVIPRSRGGHTDWDNLVACCHRCNNLKGDRLPEEAGLKLLRLPRPFTLHTSRQLMRMMARADERWGKYLFL